MKSMFRTISAALTAAALFAATPAGAQTVQQIKDKGKLVLRGYQDADNPMASGKPAYLGIDVWEHAYYLDYENRRGQHVAALVDKAINWGVVEERLKA